MIRFTATDFQRIAVSSVGALVLSATCIAGAVGPARAAAPKPATIEAWTAAVERSIADTARVPAGAYLANRATTATVDVVLDDEGRVKDATLATSTGSRVLDREALRVARAVRYPALPVSHAAAPRVSMQLSFMRSETGRRGDRKPAMMAAKPAATIALARR